MANNGHEDAVGGRGGGAEEQRAARLFTLEKRRRCRNAGGIQLKTRRRSLAGGGMIRF